MKSISLRACGRILWREAAEQYAFCIGVFALLVTMQASWMTMEAFHMIPRPSTVDGFSMALFMTAIYAAASAALLLTAEVDAGTFAFQRTKPIGWFTYLSGKLSWTILSSILLGLAAWIETGIWLGMLSSGREFSFAFGVCGVGIVEGLAWGLMASMLLREPLRAVIAGIAMASLVAWMTVVTHHTVTGGGSVFITTAYYEAAGVRLIVAVVVLATGIPLVKVWYRTGQPLRLWLLPRDVRAEARSVAIAGEWSSCSRPWRGRTIRLLWQAWRQIRTPALVYWGMCLVAVVCAGLYYVSEVDDLHVLNEQVLAASIAMTAFAAVGFSSLLSGYSFGPDQKARFLQLARDGVSPWEIWLSRLAVMGMVLLPVGLFAFASIWIPLTYNNVPFFTPPAVLIVVLGYVSVLVIGQACSMYVRSRIIALIASPVMAACFAFWIAMGVFWLGLGWKLGVAPLLLALLIGSRMLAGTRLRQDNSWRAMRVPALLIVAAFVVTYQAFASHRVNEIRPDDSMHRVGEHRVHLPIPHQMDADLARLPLSTATARRKLENALLGKGKQTPEELSGLIQNPWRLNAFQMLGPSKPASGATYQAMLAADARLNQILREVTRQPGIPNERLRACIDFLETWEHERPRRVAWLTADCERDAIWLVFGPTEVDDSYHDEPLPWRYRWFSFERKRALRLIDRVYRIAADRSEQYETALINDQVGIRPSWTAPRQWGYGLVTSQEVIPPDLARPVWYQGASQSVLNQSAVSPFYLMRTLGRLGWNRSDPLYMAESQRRGTILYLALRMYYNDHAELPETLEALVEGRYLACLPVVPTTAKPFYFEREGASEELESAIKTQDPLVRNLAYGFSDFFEHDSTGPFLWYPADPNQHMDPGAVPGLFIDIDFVE
jgi:hypothetical protein